MRDRVLLAVLCAALAACAGEPDGPTPEQLAARESAARDACVATRLHQRATDELATLEQVAGGSGIIGFQRAYESHARLRLTVAAQIDTALNHASNSQDSAAHAAAAERIRISVPDPESVEANVIRSYETNAAAIFGDPDHPCNWQSELDPAGDQQN
jgi:hypothetical protein